MEYIIGAVIGLLVGAVLVYVFGVCGSGSRRRRI